MIRENDDYPAVSRLQNDLRQAMLSAAEHGQSAKPRARFRRFARPLAVLGALAVIPAAFAVAELRSDDFPEDQRVAIDRNLEPVLCPDGKPLIVDGELTTATCPDGSVPEGVVGERELGSGAGEVTPPAPVTGHAP